MTKILLPIRREHLGRTIVLGVALSLFAWLVPSTPAEAALVYCGGGYYGDDGCKYAQARNDIDSGSNYTDVDSADVRGETASGSCDPSNDIDQWNVDNIELRDASSNNLIWSTGPHGPFTNCDLQAKTYSVNKRIFSDAIMTYEFTIGSGSTAFPKTMELYIATPP